MLHSLPSVFPSFDGGTPRFPPFRPQSELYTKYVEQAGILRILSLDLLFSFDINILVRIQTCLAKLDVLYEMMYLDDILRVDKLPVNNMLVRQLLPLVSEIFNETNFKQRRDKITLLDDLLTVAEHGEAECLLH